MEIDPKALIAVLAGEATEEERAVVGRWRAASAANEAEYRQHERVWGLLGALSVETGHAPEDAAGGSADPAPIPPKKVASGWSARSRRARGFAGAALAAAAVLSAVLLFRGEREGSGYAPLAAADVSTGPDEVQTVQLRDGTIVRLGPNSRLGFTDVAVPRDVYVEGQAYFVVPGGQSDPFRVHSSRGQVEVVGTRFEVAARGEQIQVLVVEGEVELEANEETVNLRRGEAGTVVESSAPVVDPAADVYGMTAWIGAFAAYEETPLEEIAEEFQRRFGFTIEIADPALSGRTVSGMMRDQSVEEMASNVCIAVGASCSFTPGRMRMDLAEPSPVLPAPLAPGSTGRD